MPDSQGVAAFPGIEQLLSASLALSSGVRPSVATLEIVPQPRLDTLVGPLTFSCGDTLLRFLDCQVDSATLVHNSAGMIVRVSLVDRRWRWQGGVISGRYNVWREPASLYLAQEVGSRSSRREFVLGTERTPRELCALCLDALGERDYDLSGVANEPRPTIAWDYAPLADALAELVRRVDCRIVLRTDNTVAVVRRGQGRELPRGDDVTEMSVLLNSPESPDVVTVVCGEKVFQLDLPLEAVGQDIDGSVRPIDELSYRPESGWLYADVEHMNEVSDLRARALARATVFRWYRVASFAEAIPSELRPAKLQLRHLLPLRREQLDTRTRNGQEIAKEAQVFGVWHDPRRNVDFGNSAEQLRPLVDEGDPDAEAALVREAFELDVDRGLVIFPEPLYRLEENDGGFLILPAELRLRTSSTVRDPATGVRLRYERRRGERGVASARAPFLSHPEIVPIWKVRYDDDYQISEIENNLAAVDVEADRYAAAFVERGGVARPETIGYAGLKRIELDGAIEQVTWSVGLSGATTRASRNATTA